MRNKNMHSWFFYFLAVLALSLPLLAWGQSGGDFSNNTNPAENQKVPTGVILVKGAWSSASDSTTPLPEGGSITNNVYSSQYFGLSYPFSADWFQKTQGPPPSDSGFYVLAQLRPTPSFKGPAKGTILISAEDMFFTRAHAANALELINYTKDNLHADYKVELPPAEIKIAGKPFSFFAYWSPVAELHWYVVATQIRCHTVEIVFTSRDTKMLEGLIQDMNKMKLPADAGDTSGKGGGEVPVCIKNYADGKNMLERVEPVFTGQKFNPVPVRIIIGKGGTIKHIHIISAFPDQAKAITEALEQWRFKPYLQNGQPVEVETGIMFGRASRPTSPSGAPTTTD